MKRLLMLVALWGWALGAHAQVAINALPANGTPSNADVVATQEQPSARDGDGTVKTTIAQIDSTADVMANKDVTSATNTFSHLNITGNQVITGASTASNSWLWQNGPTVSGTATGTPTPNLLSAGSDTVDTTTSGGGNLIFLSVGDAPQAGFTGGREAFQCYLQIVGAPAVAEGTAGLVGCQSQLRINSNLGGTTGAYTNSAGYVFAGNDNIFAQSGATFMKGLVGREIDTAIPTGASASDHYGLSIVETSTHAVAGTYDDAGLDFNNQSGVTAGFWNYGISFGGYAHLWPFGATSTLIGAQIQQVPGVGTSIAKYGVDFRNVTFQSGGYAFASTGWNVDPSGNENVLSIGATAPGTASFKQTIAASSNLSAASWGVSGIGLITYPVTYTDTSASGTIANEFVNVLNGSAVAATNTGVTMTNLSTLYVAAPTAGANVTASNRWAIQTGGNLNVGGYGQFTSGGGLFGGVVTINNSSNFATHVGDGTTNAQVTVGSTNNTTVLGSTTLELTGIAATSAGQTGTVCIGASSILTYDTTTTCLLSDGRLKTNVSPLDVGIDEVMKLKPVSYDLKPESNPTHLGRQVGLIAQDVMKVDPRLAATYQSGPNEGTPSGVRYEQMVALLVKAVQEQQHEIDGLKRQLKHRSH